jgi:hypothetical protein
MASTRARIRSYPSPCKGDTTDDVDGAAGSNVEVLGLPGNTLLAVS